MSDYTISDLQDQGQGYWLITYGRAYPPSGPFESVKELAHFNGLFEYPKDGYIVYRDADGSMGTVPSVNPDDLLQFVAPEGAEEAYRKFYAVPDYEEVDLSLVVEWYEDGLGR